MKIEQIKVVAGLILQNNKLLICQRPNFKDHPLKWEFPGGKIKNDETNEEALIREINEELSINIINYEELISYDFNYKDLNKKVFIYFYLVNNFSGKVLNNFHKELKWIEIKDIREYDFLEGDLKIIDHISSNDFKY
jgi:8-oxo-dGTP diphosphatase